MSSDIPSSPFSSTFWYFSSWTAADIVICSGAVAVDEETNKVLLLREADGTLYLPWAKNSKGDVGELIVSPFEQIARETGYAFEKLPCRLPRRSVEPRPGDNTMHSVVRRSSEAAVDPFYISFDVLWTKANEKWYDSHQRMTMWFACKARATDATARANAQAVWMTVSDAQATLGTQGRRSLPDCAVLKQFDFMWP